MPGLLCYLLFFGRDPPPFMKIRMDNDFKHVSLSSFCHLQSHLRLFTNRIRQLRHCSSIDFSLLVLQGGIDILRVLLMPFPYDPENSDLGSGITASSCWLSKVQPAFAVQMHPVLVFELHVFICKVSIPEMPSLTFHFFSGWKIHSWRSTNSHWCFRARL